MQSDGDDKQVNWDFSRTTDEQLLRLEQLWKTGSREEVTAYTQQLINEGFLSRTD